jgi:patatin-like phospholipase/acyl hydrolase
LSIDGGGIRGVIASKILYLIEKEFNISIYDYFDIFTGTSVGSMIISSIVYGKYTGKNIHFDLMSNENINKIMGQTFLDRLFSNVQIWPKYNGIEKHKIIEDVVGSETLLRNTEKKVIIPCYEVDSNKTHYFRSWDDTENMYTVLDITNASSAAPSYFPGVTIGSKNFVDGAVTSNNPTDVAYCEALKIFPHGSEIKILSIGSGKPVNKTKYFKNWGGVQWVAIGGIFSLVMQGADDLADYKTLNLANYLGHKYIRLDGYINNGSIDDISEKNISHLLDIGDKWFNENRCRLKQFFN